jgi:hypothetical protein
MLALELSEGEASVLRIEGSALTLPARKIRSADLEAVSVADDAAVALVRISAENGEWLALVGGRSGKELLRVTRSDWVGDPGERHASVLERQSVAGAAHEQVRLGTRHEGLARCDGKPVLSSIEEIDPKQLKLVAARPAEIAAAGTPLAASAVGEAAMPRLQLLRAISSSQRDEITQTPRTPAELVDQRVDTSWPITPGGLALLRWSAPALPIERLELTWTGRSAPLALNIGLEGGAYHVSLAKPSGSPDRVAIALPAGTKSACLSLEVVGASAAGVGLAEVQAFTLVDQPDGIARLVGDLVQDAERGALAAELLAELGEPAARSVAARFAELSVRGQRRALRVLARALTLPEVRARVVEAARSKDAALSQTTFDMLRQAKDPGRLVLREIALGADVPADRAAQLLSANGVSDAEGLLAALATPAGPERPNLRRALVSVAKREPDTFRAASQSWQATNPSASARIGLALAAALADLDDVAAPIVEANLAAAGFSDRFRLCLVAAQLGPSPSIDAWLAKQAREASEWMQRLTAYDALLMRNSEQAHALVGDIAKDAYPRVRAAATTEYARTGKSAPLAELARKDPWALVRAAAATGLGSVPQTRAVLEELLGDSSRFVRIASIDSLLQQKAAAAWPLVAKRLSASNEWPAVQTAAVRFAAGLCVQAARAPLTEIARRALRADASDEDRELGLAAIRALHDLGGEADKDAQLIATREGGPPQLKQAFAAFGPSRCSEARAPINEAEATRAAAPAP